MYHQFILLLVFSYFQPASLSLITFFQDTSPEVLRSDTLHYMSIDPWWPLSSLLLLHTHNTTMTTFTPKIFSNPIVDKLDDESFLTWQKLTLASIKGQNLEDHLDKDKILKWFTSKEDDAAGIKSQSYKEWWHQDYHQLLSSMYAAFKNRMVGCNFACEIWKRIESYFTSQTKAKVKQLKTQLKAIKKQGPCIKIFVKNQESGRYISSCRFFHFCWWTN